MVERVYRTKLVLDTTQHDAGAAKADTALQRVAASTDELSRHLQLASVANDRFVDSTAAQAAVLEQARRAQAAQAAAIERTRAAQAGQATVLGAPDQSAANAALANIRVAAQARERTEYRNHQQVLENIRVAAQAKERADYQQQQQFLQGLQRQADTIGKTRSELLALQAAQLGVSTQAAPMIARLAAGERQLAGFGRTGKLTAQELAQVSFQLNDLAVQVASGGSPLIALVQQGSQLSGTFGGIRPAISALLSTLTPLRLAVGGVAAGVGVLAIAYAQGYREDVAFRDSLVLTGNAAGLTADSFNRTARAVESGANVTTSSAREITQALVSTGEVGPAALQSVALAVAQLQRVTGASSADIVKQFAGITASASRWALEQNRQYNFLTPKVYEHIRALEAQGQKQEAARVAADALAEKIASQTRNLGLLERAIEGAERTWSSFWNTVKSIGRDTTIDDRIAQITAAMEAAQSPEEVGDGRDALRAELAVLEEQKRARDRKAVDDAKAASDNKRELAKLQDDYQSALHAKEKAGFEQSLAQQRVALEAQRIALDRSYDQAELSVAAYVQRRAQLEQQAIASKAAAIDQDIALERRRKVGTEAEVLQQEARLRDLQARRTALQVERLRLAQEQRRNFGVTDERVSLPVASDALRRLEPADESGVVDYLRQQRDQADQLANQLLRDARSLSAGLITDERARADALLAIEVEQLRQRLDLETRHADDRARVEEQLAGYIVQRNREITEQLKPEWQRQVELYEDSARRRKQVNEDVNKAFVDGGREAFGRMFADGKLSFDNLAQYALRTLGEQFYERMGFGRFFAQLGDAVFGGIEGIVGLGVPASSGLRVDTSSAGQVDNPSAARDALRQVEAAAADQVAQMVATTAASATEATVTQQAVASLVGLTGAAQSAAAALAAVGGSGGGSGGAGLLGSLFGSGGGFFNDAGGLELLGSLGFARGGAFRDGHVQAFARGGVLGPKGGVLDALTAFPIRGGRVGIGGEAGDEAVMPLGRTRDGRMGVAVVGGGGAAPTVVNRIEIINNHSGARVRTEPRQDGGMRVLIDQVEGALGERISNGVGLAQPIGTRFGMNGGAGLIT